MKWQNESTISWKELLISALPALNQLPKDLEWDLGGGTALMLSINHRMSKDIDIFFENARALKLLAPSVNERTRRICDEWQQPGHYIKLMKFDKGEIDFLISRTFEENPTIEYTFENNNITQIIKIETPKEIISKKIFHRASEFTMRDIFDAAAVLEKNASALHDLSPDVIEKLPLVIDRITIFRDEYSKEIERYITPIDVPDCVLRQGPEIVIEALSLELKKEKKIPKEQDKGQGL